VVNKSTVPVGTAAVVRAAIATELASRNASVPFDVVSNPEFLKEGAAVKDCMQPDRIVIGSDTPEAAAVLRKLYSPFMRNHERVVDMASSSEAPTHIHGNAHVANKPICSKRI